MAAKIISQKRFAKLVASTGALSQPPGALTRLSNLLYTQRGSLQIADGSLAVSAPISPASLIAAIASFANLQPGQFPYYELLAYSSTPQLADVTNFVVSSVSGSTDNPLASYTFDIAATLGDTHTNARNSSYVLTSAFDTVNFTWTAVAGATGYTIYYVYRPAGFPFSYLISLGTSVTTSFSHTGTLPITPSVNPTPDFNNTYELILYVNTDVATPIDFSEVTGGVFPFTIPQPAALAPGSPGFSANPAVIGFSPYGGTSGIAGPLPQLIQFAAQSILILGNGYAPQAYDPALGPGGAVTALANTFTAAYPTWQASVSWLTGSQLAALYGSTNYLFTATQGGVSGSGTTPFTGTPPVKGVQIADGSVIWTSEGPIVASVAPRGAAHAVAYAGSLWLANTSPTTTSDGIDGPTCIKMSDSNNPNSWNPVNVAFIAKDDGTQITGLQPFTIAALGISPTGSLCVFKEFTTYQVIGVFGASSFEIQPAQTNLGCIAPRSIQFLPGFGVVRFTHLGFAVFDGINDRLISEDIRPYLFGGVDSEADLTPVDPSYLYLAQSAQTTQPPMYICAMPLTGGSGALTRLFCYDLVMKSWAVLDLPWAIHSLGTMSVGEGYPLVLAGKADGTIQRIQSGDVNWDQGDAAQSAVNWSFRSPDVYGEGSTQRLFYEQATIRGYGSASMVSSIVANLWLDGAQIGSQAVDVVPQGGSNLFEARVKIFKSGYRAHIDFSGNNGGAAGIIDSIDWSVSPKSSLARRIIG